MTLVTKQSRYYEGILQLRNPNAEIISFIKSQLRKENVYVTQEVHVAEGIDIYVTSRKFLRTLANRLKGQFGGSASLSARIHTKDRQTQKDVYRVSLLYRAPTLRRSNIIVVGDHIVRVKNVSKFVTGTDLKTGKQYSFKYDPSFKALDIYDTRVIKIHPALEVLHPTTYQPVEAIGMKEFKMGEKVRVVFVGKECYIIS